ncbi:MAG TPA: DUF192 domain-containing protein [Woeseiaceae bacterium]|nr:DUF192 domain-containing protein [Woeseiaceae bacterium]
MMPAGAAWLVLLHGLLLQAAAAAGFDTTLDEAFERDVLVIAASQHACYRFDVYLAVERTQKSRGLMFVRDLPERTGMLFVYENADYHSMWMKNTFIPLDIAFAREDGTIAAIAHRTEPQSLATIAPDEPVSYVLELNAGVAERLHIDEGSRLLLERR